MYNGGPARFCGEKMLDFNKVNKLIDDGYISRRKHPKDDLWILNYTHKCQYDWKWTKETILCRGLIVDKENNIVEQAFPKFFSLDQYKDLRNSIHQLYGLKYKNMFDEVSYVGDKVDGSLGVLYKASDGPAIATRGSFESEQAIKGTEILRSKYPNFYEKYHNYNSTHLFEIIYPENRIVVDYGKQEKLVYLGKFVKSRQTWHPVIVEKLDGVPCAKSYDFESLKDILEADQPDNMEGYVVQFKSGALLKFKFDDYVRLHRIMTNLSDKNIWELVKDGVDLEDFLKDIPDEFYKEIEEKAAQFKKRYERIERTAQYTFETFSKEYTERVYFAKEATKLITPLPSILFSMLDKKDYSDIIWRYLKP